MKIKNKSWDVEILQITKEWSMFLKKMGIHNEKSPWISTDQGVQWINTYKIKTKYTKRFQVSQKNTVQGISRPLSEMLENPENPFLNFNFQVAVMFHVGPYGEHKKIALMLTIRRDKKLLHIKARFSWTKKFDLLGENGVMLYLQTRKNGI